MVEFRDAPESSRLASSDVLSPGLYFFMPHSSVVGGSGSILHSEDCSCPPPTYRGKPQSFFRILVREGALLEGGSPRLRQLAFPELGRADQHGQLQK